MIIRTTIGDNFKAVTDYLHAGRSNESTDKQPLMLFSEGVRTDSSQSMAADFIWGSSLNPNLGQPVWHSVISFNPDDTAVLTNEKMLAVAQDFREEMKLTNTQCVIIRHFDKEDNQHLHILVNRVADDGHSIRDRNNFYNAKVTAKALVERHELSPTAGQRPELQHPERIVGAYDKAGAQIRQALAYGLQTATEREQLWQMLKEKEIATNESSRGVSFTKDEFAFKGSQVAREYSLGGIDKQLAANRLAQAYRIEQEQAETSLSESVRYRAQEVLTNLVDRKAFASRGEFIGQVAERGYTFVTTTEREEKLRHGVSGREFALTAVQPEGPTGRPLWEQAEEVIQARKAEEEAQRVAEREAVRQEIEQVLTRTRDVGLRYPYEFFERLRTQPLDFERDTQTGQITQVHHRKSNEKFAWSEVQPGGVGAPPLAEQLDRAVRATEQQAAARDWARDRIEVEKVVAQVRQERRFSDQTGLIACLQEQGVSLLDSGGKGGSHQFVLEATGQRFPERAVLREHSVTEILTEAGMRRQTAEIQTKHDVREVLNSPVTPLIGLQDYQRQLEATGYKLIEESGQESKIEHLASGEQFTLDQVRPSHPTELPLLEQIKEVIERQKQGHQIQKQAVADVEQVLAAKSFVTWSGFETQVQNRGYQFVTGIDGSERLLHEESQQHFPLAKILPYDQDLRMQVNEIIANRPPELEIKGQIHVPTSSVQSATERAANIQQLLVTAGASVSIEQPAAGASVEEVIVNYSHTLRKTQLDQVNKALEDIELSKGLRVQEQVPGSGLSPAQWPKRDGEYAQATLVFNDSTTQQTAYSEQVAAQLEQAGAVARRQPGSPETGLVLEVDYHTKRSEVRKITQYFDDWQQGSSEVEVRETPRGSLTRGIKSQSQDQSVDEDYGME